MPSTTIPNLIVDPPLALDAKFRYDIPDRAYLDAQIRGCEQHLYDSGGLNGTQCAWYVVDGASASLVIGDVVCLAGTAGAFRNVTKATAAALAAAGRALGVVMNPAGPGVNVRVAIAGTLPTSITGLAASANIAIRVSSAARCQNVASFGGSDYPVGFADAQGNLSLLLLSTPTISGGGGSLAGDVTGTIGANTVVQLTGSANSVAIPINTALDWNGANGPEIATRDSGLGLNLKVRTTNNSIALVDGSVTWAFFNYNSGSPFFQAFGLPMQFQTTGANSLRMAATGTGELDLDGTIVKIRNASGATTVFQANATGLGVFGVTPIARVSAYTVTNHTARRAIDETAITLAQLANVVGTMIIDLQNYGWFQ